MINPRIDTGYWIWRGALFEVETPMQRADVAIVVTEDGTVCSRTPMQVQRFCTIRASSNERSDKK